MEYYSFSTSHQPIEGKLGVCIINIKLSHLISQPSINYTVEISMSFSILFKFLCDKCMYKMLIHDHAVKKKQNLWEVFPETHDWLMNARSEIMLKNLNYYYFYLFLGGKHGNHGDK